MVNIKTYCLKCRKKTSTVNGRFVNKKNSYNKNNKYYKGKCQICKSKKSTFVAIKKR